MSARQPGLVARLDACDFHNARQATTGVGNTGSTGRNREWQYDILSKPLARCSSRPGRWPCERCCTIIRDSTLAEVAGVNRIHHGGIAVSVWLYLQCLGIGRAAKPVSPGVVTPRYGACVFCIGIIILRAGSVQGYPDIPKGDHRDCRIYCARGTAGPWSVCRALCINR